MKNTAAESKKEQKLQKHNQQHH